MTWQFKDPDEVLDYQIDWTSVLGSDTILTSSWVVPAGITEDSSSNTDTATTILLSGGTDGVRYDLLNEVTTSDGRTLQQAASIFIREKAVIPVLNATVGGASSDSYVSEVEYLDYALKRGWTVNTGQEANLRAARIYLDTAYIWKGRKVTTTQALEWPRIITGYVEGFPVSSESIPQAIIDAQCEMAYLLQGGATPQATLTTGGILRERKKFDVMEKDTTYANARELAAYPLIDALVSPYVERKQGAVSGSIPLARA